MKSSKIRLKQGSRTYYNLVPYREITKCYGKKFNSNYDGNLVLIFQKKNLKISKVRGRIRTPDLRDRTPNVVDVFKI